MVFIFFLLVPLLTIQDLPGPDMVVYSADYEFRDGLYMNPDMVKANRPVPPARIVSDREKYDNKFYNDLLKGEFITINDNRGVRTLIKPGQVWGYAHKGVLYIQIGQSFQRLTLEGNLSRFAASSTTYDERTKKQFDSGAYPSRYYYGPYRRPSYSYSTRSGAVYLLDFETNTLYNYTPDDLEKVLIRDTELLLEYGALKRSQRKKKQLEFIRRYNDRHPLYLPAPKAN